MLLGIFVRAFRIDGTPYSRQGYTHRYGEGIATSTGRWVDQYWLPYVTSTTSRRDQYWSDQ